MFAENIGGNDRMRRQLSRAKNLVVTGFMGTGKSTIGKAVAERLGREFVDMDEVIAIRAGRTIAQIFADDGEDAFREAESALARELGERVDLVIATGGGTLLRAENRRALEENGLIVCLTCAPEEIACRLAGDGTRPLLSGSLPKPTDRRDESQRAMEERVRDLLAERLPVYTSLPVVIDTTGHTVSEVVAAVLRACAEG